VPSVVGDGGGVRELREGGVEVEPAERDEPARVLDGDPVDDLGSFVELVGGPRLLGDRRASLTSSSGEQAGHAAGS
jgi:hypothetical protein